MCHALRVHREIGSIFPGIVGRSSTIYRSCRSPEDFGNFLSIDSASQQFVSERMKNEREWVNEGEKERVSEWEREGERVRERIEHLYDFAWETE